MKTEDYLPVEELLSASNGSIYALAVLAAKRALQLADGEKALVDTNNQKPLDNALREIAEKKIVVKPKKK